MTRSSNPLKWTQPLNPKDEVEYTFDMAGRILETGETVDAWTLTFSDASIAAGLVEGTGEYATALGAIVNGEFQIDPNGTILRIWFSIDPTHQNDSAFDEAGIWLDMNVHVTTTNDPPRIRDRTLLLRICRQ
jgi:hypothetical protein